MDQIADIDRPIGVHYVNDCVADPEATLEKVWRANGDVPKLYIIPWVLSESWQKNQPRVQLNACYLTEHHNHSSNDKRATNNQHPHITHIGVFAGQLSESDIPSHLPVPNTRGASKQHEALRQWISSFDKNADVIALNGSIPLGGIFIPKPWGAELWHSGIEERGVSCMGPQTCLPIPRLLAAAPRRLLGSDQFVPPILLKELVPHAQAPYGDLYFELHQSKREVYVVTHVDQKAWPDGKGKIRLGISADKRGQYASEKEFRTAYRQCLERYETVRQQIDALLEQQTTQDAHPDANDVERLQARRAKLPEKLLQEESDARKATEDFSVLRSISVGDVIKIPLHVPHALQHGVRVVEFQTPVYERQIISFAQKVLTQKGWDVASAVRLMQLDTPDDAIVPAHHQEGMIAEFEDFAVYATTLKAKTKLHDMIGSNGYAIGLGIGADVMSTVKGCPAQTHKAGEAFWVPPGVADKIYFESLDVPARVLVATARS